MGGGIKGWRYKAKQLPFVNFKCHRQRAAGGDVNGTSAWQFPRCAYRLKTQSACPLYPGTGWLDGAALPEFLDWPERAWRYGLSGFSRTDPCVPAVSFQWRSGEPPGRQHSGTLVFLIPTSAQLDQAVRQRWTAVVRVVEVNNLEDASAYHQLYRYKGIVTSGGWKDTTLELVLSSVLDAVGLDLPSRSIHQRLVAMSHSHPLALQ